MADISPSVDDLCRAIMAGDERMASEQRRRFAGDNFPLVHIIDRLAHAEFTAGQFGRAARKLVLLEELVPGSTGYALRRMSAAIHAGEPGALAELGASAHRLGTDGEMFHACEELVSAGRADLADRLIEAGRARGVFSEAILAACRSRVLATTGRVGEAIALLQPLIADDRPDLTVMRCLYLLLENMLCFDASREVSRRAALVWGEERDLRHTVERLTYIFDYSGAARLLRTFSDRHPERAAQVGGWASDALGTSEAAAAAIAEHGPAAGVDPARIFAVLSESGGSASLVLWGKQALVALLRGGPMTEADYARFAWFLPNWEEGLIRTMVLSAARDRFPASAPVQRGWLHYLVTQGIYADAARHCLSLLKGAVDEDLLFLGIGLLRLHLDRVVPPFLDTTLSEALRLEILARVPATAPGFRAVMRDHVVALGGPSMPWTDDAVPGPDSTPEIVGLRRLFAITTGRLSRISTPRPLGDDVAPPPIRPVLAISGQLRGFETAWASIHARLCAPIGAPVVMSVWDKSANALGRHARRLERTLPDDVVAKLRPEDRYTDAFELAYPETYRLLFGQTDVDAAAIRALIDASGCEVIAVETEQERLIAKLLPPYISSNMLKMYYKFARIEELIRAEETRTGQIFSHVVWTRPDTEVVRLSADDLRMCVSRHDIVWSSFTTENSFGDYAMVLPRRAFAAIASIFPRAVTGGDTVLLPWRPNRATNPAQRSPLGAFGGPDVLFDILLAEGYLPLSRIPRMVVRLLGRTPGDDLVRQTFDAEQARSLTA